MRLIDADAVVKQISGYIRPGRNDFNTGINTGARTALEILGAAPEVDAKPVQHGRWGYASIGCYDPMCSECKDEANYETPWCPNCGAKMDGEQETEPGLPRHFIPRNDGEGAARASAGKEETPDESAISAEGRPNKTSIV